MKQSATLICDYDGTLHESLAIYKPAFHAEYARLIARGLMKKRSIADAELKRWIGMSTKDMWKEFAPDLSEAEKQRASRRIGEEMIALIRCGRARLYPHTETVLNKLKNAGYSLVILSNCTHAYMEAHRNAFGLDAYFSGWYCAQDYSWASKENIFPYITDRFGEPYVVIGDRHYDIKLANAYGLSSIGCAYGYGSLKELEGATVRIHTVDEIPKALEKLSE